MLRLDQAKVTGQLCLRDAVIGDAAGPPTAKPVAAFGLAVDGGVECTALTTHGACWHAGRHHHRWAGPAGARIACPGQRALILWNAVIGGQFDGGGLSVDGEIRMHNTRIGGSMVMAAARLVNPGGVALSAGGLTVAGGVFLTEGFRGGGRDPADRRPADANLSLTGAVLSNPDGTALDLAGPPLAPVTAPASAAPARSSSPARGSPATSTCPMPS